MASIHLLTARLQLPAHHRVRHDTIDSGGSVTLRYRSKLYHIGVGRRHAGTAVIILVKDLDVRILSHDGTQLRRLTLNPARNYQPTGRPPGLCPQPRDHPENRHEPEP